MPDFDAAPLVNQAVKDAERQVHVHTERLKVLRQFNTTSQRSPFIRQDADDHLWHVWIPPYKDHHFAGNTPVRPFGDRLFDTLPEATEFLDTTLAWLAGGEAPPPAPPIPDTPGLRELLDRVAETWDGDEMPNWRGNEYARGQVELIYETVSVRVDGEDEIESEEGKDRIWRWVIDLMAPPTIESVGILTKDGFTELPTTMPIRFKLGADVRHWIEYELADATELELEVLEQENDESVELARALLHEGRLVEHGDERDDHPDYFTDSADTAVLDVEVVARWDKEQADGQA